MPLGRNGLIGMAVAGTAGLGLIALIVYREVRRRRSQRVALVTGRTSRLLDTAELAALLRENHDPQGQAAAAAASPEREAQQQALAAVEAVVQALTPEQQQQLRSQLDQVLSCVSALRSEVAELRGGLQDIALQIIQDVKKGVEDNQRTHRRRHRERTDSASSSSVYFTASPGIPSAAEENSEAGYSTAYADSDYTDRDTDREELEQRQESEEEEEEEEDRSCATVLTLRQEDSQEEEEEEEEVVAEEEEWKPQLVAVEAPPSGELALLLAQSDVLHTGDATLKAEGFRLLQDNRAEYGDSREFQWRLARAYSDMYRSTHDQRDKRAYAQQGREEAESALRKSGLNAECHKWFALLTVMTSEYESMHQKLKSSHVLKEHVERALALGEEEPVFFYLLGRWCYQIATLDWLEKKAAAALYRSPPAATLNDALENFLKAEELSPGFSRMVRLYIAKCHKELGNLSAATNWTELALKMPEDADHDEETEKLEAQLQVLW
ncbi:regulator of microtubule dynamics protein 3 isoform X3 [Nelusetta ayraudi]|uniref:regulator of microtubule dynamics protein 3 isoform X3 n=1 Tax=Nelusetta ayraudi TaxID=303726 RepID=UPI003F7226C1